MSAGIFLDMCRNKPARRFAFWRRFSMVTRPAQIWGNCDSKVFVRSDNLDRLFFDNDCSTCAHCGCCLTYWKKSLKICLSPRGNTKPPLFVMVVRRFGPLALLQLLQKEVTEEGPVVRNVLQPSRTTEALCCHGGRDKFLNCFSSAFSPD